MVYSLNGKSTLLAHVMSNTQFHSTILDRHCSSDDPMGIATRVPGVCSRKRVLRTMAGYGSAEGERHCRSLLAVFDRSAYPKELGGKWTTEVSDMIVLSLSTNEDFVLHLILRREC